MALPRGVVIHPDELGDQWFSRLCGSAIKTVGLHPVGGKKANESLEALFQAVKRGECDTKFEKLKQMGIALEYEVHAMSWLLPRELFATHPDWFRENEAGERVADFNLCVSAPGALTYVADRAAELAQVLRPTTHRYHLWIDDVRNSFCHCEKCRNLTPSDQALTVYNALLKGIRRVDPLATQCYLAYQNTEATPVSVKPDEGIFLEYAPFDRDFHTPLSDKSSEKNQRETAPVPELLRFFGKENAKVLEYWLDNSLFSKWKKPPQAFVLDLPVLREDLLFYEKLGFSDVTVFACYLGEDYQALYGEPEIDAYLKD
ncbi:MAG: DUF4838 domain-containing protein [Ruminococcaceae bacterium]|nr:DUF4838 domain-containing protein [Oscillospiraceae bacterium]